jgi:hypothetical protein
MDKRRGVGRQAIIRISYRVLVPISTGYFSMQNGRPPILLRASDGSARCVRTRRPHSSAQLLKAPDMIVATRDLILRQGGKQLIVPVRIHAPTPDGEAWTCSFEIVWPDETWGQQVAGADAVQSLRLAMEAIGVELYFSRHHKSGNLSWKSASGGYGFPVPHNARHLLVGDDAIFDR